MRITGQLVETATGAHLWADKFEGMLGDIFELQDRVTSGVVGIVAPKIEQAEIERATRKPTTNLQAHDYYLRGISSHDKLTREANENALRMFLKAIEFDPNFAAAMAYVCHCYNQRVYQGWQSDTVTEVADALRWAKASLECGGDDAFVLASASGTLSFFPNETSQDFRAALTEQALRLNSNLPWAWYRSGYGQIFGGDHDTALKHFSTALQLNPLDQHSLYAVSYMTGVATAYFFKEQNIDAENWAQRSLDRNPSFSPTLRILIATKSVLDKDEEATQLVRRLLEISPAEQISNIALYRSLARSEDKHRFSEALQKAGLPL